MGNTAKFRVLLQEGAEQFNLRRYWHAHEPWEKAWRSFGPADSSPEKIYLQGLIQAVASFYLLEERRFVPAVTLADAALIKIRQVDGSGVAEGLARVAIPGLEEILARIPRIGAGLSDAEADAVLIEVSRLRAHIYATPSKRA